MKYIVLYIIVLAGCFTACQKEDSLTPSNINDLFAPDPEATDAESGNITTGFFQRDRVLPPVLMIRYAMSIKEKILSVIRITKRN